MANNPTKKKNIIVIGCYGCGNKGDDAILESIVTHFAEDFNINVTCGSHGNIKKQFHVNAIPCRLNEGFHLGLIPHMFIFYLRYVLQVLKAQFVIIGGGSLIHDMTPYNLPFFFVLQNTAKLFGRKVYYLGSGAGPLSTQRGKKLCRRNLNNADGIYIRDIPDVELLREIGVNNVELIADLAFAVKSDMDLAKPILERYGLHSQKYIALTACEWFQSENFWTKDTMDFRKEKEILTSSIARTIDETGLTVVFLPTVVHDTKLANELKEMLNKENFIVLSNELTSGEMASVVANAKLLIGTRMHSIIFAIRAGVPFIANIYASKVKTLVERIGMEKYVIDFCEMNSDKYIELLRNVLAHEEEIRGSLMEGANALEQYAVNGYNDLSRNYWDNI